MDLPVTVPNMLPHIAVCAVEAKQAPVEWKPGTDNLGGWKYGGKYGYKGKPELGGDKAFGGSIRLSVDFSRNANDSWSEIKLENEEAGVKPLSIKGQNTLSFNLYFKPENMTQGGFKLKLYGKSVEEQEVINVCPELDLFKAKDAGNGMKCLPVQINFPSVDASLSYLCLSLVGSSTDYKGDLYIGQMKLSEEKVPDGFVDVKIAPKKQAKVQLNQLALPTEAALVDAQAAQEWIICRSCLRRLYAAMILCALKIYRSKIWLRIINWHRLFQMYRGRNLLECLATKQNGMVEK